MSGTKLTFGLVLDRTYRARTEISQLESDPWRVFDTPLWKNGLAFGDAN